MRKMINKVKNFKNHINENVNNNFTDYYLTVNLDERGYYSATVYNPLDERVFNISSAEEMLQLIDDGWLKYKADEDLTRLTIYLIKQGIIPNGSEIYSDQEFDEKIRDEYTKL